jgi:hypothetical protein
MKSWQFDFKDSVSVVVDPDGKRQHVVEILNVVEIGGSILIESIARDDYNAQTVLQTLADILLSWGLPNDVTFDNDTRFVGADSSSDFPSAMRRFWHGLDVKMNKIPAHRPALNGFVERFNGSQGRECLNKQQPKDLGEVREAIDWYKQHYNWERPHQGFSCKNQPPHVAFPELPALRNVPMWINPDGWLAKIDGEMYTRRVGKEKMGG